MIKFIALAVALAAAATVAQAQSYPPYPYNLLYRNGTPRDQGYSDGYRGLASPADTDSITSEYGIGVARGRSDYWLDRERESREEFERRRQADPTATSK